MELLLLLLLLIVVFGGGGGWYGHSRWGPRYGYGIGFGAVVFIILVFFLLGGFDGLGLRHRWL